MRRAPLAVAAAFALLVLGIVSAPAAGSTAPPPPALLLPAAIPPDLQALEAKTEALQITSVRFSVKFTVNAGSAIPKELAAVLGFSIEGVETVSPPAAAMRLVLFGQTLRLRVIGDRVYYFSWPLGRVDGGRPWVELGKGPLGKLLGGVGRQNNKSRLGPSGKERFGAMITALNEGKGIRELGASIVDGQPVSGFEEEPELGSSGSAGESALLGGFTAAARKPPPGAPRLKTTLRIYFAATGMPVHIVIASGTAQSGSMVTADFPAVNFPYTIPPPPPSHVISERSLERRFKPHRGVAS